MKKYKLIFTVPIPYADKMREEIGKVGGGKLGNYSFCSFSTRGTGRFKPEEGANPAVGKIGNLEEVEEERIECQCEEQVVDDVIAALKKFHPYEEIAYDLFPLETRE
jgi:hypothetical protein